MNESNKIVGKLMPLLVELTKERQESFKVVLTQALNISYKEGRIDGMNQLRERIESLAIDSTVPHPGRIDSCT